jgi:endoglucanase
MVPQFPSRGPAGRCAGLGVAALVLLVMLPGCDVGAAATNLTAPIRIRLNSVGYLPDAPKKASIAAACEAFSVVRVPDNTVALTGRATGPIWCEDTKEQLYAADFSALRQPGEYRLEVPGVGRCAPFRVSADVCVEPFRTAMLGMYLWRCGTAVSAVYRGQTFAHGPCHTNDAWLDYVGGGHARKDGTRGWHDAGDYNKYTVNAGLAMGTLFRAWEDFGPGIRKVRLQIPESGGPIPDFLSELKWEMDWVLTMQADDGSVYHKLTTLRFGGFVMPEAERSDRYFTPWGSEATADFVGMAAQAARIYRPYDAAYAERCLRAARKSYAFLKAHPAFHPPDQTNFHTGTYEIRADIHESSHRPDNVPNNRLWAESELWETTGSPEVLRDLETRIRTVRGRVNFAFDWDEVKDLGLLTYLFSTREGRDPALVNLVRSNLLAVADDMVRTNREFAYANPYGSRYGWGYNGYVARQSLVLMAADRLTRGENRRQYRDACLDALNYLFGRNFYGRSFVTGVGFDPPMHPHDRRSGADGIVEPWPGYLVGGPFAAATDWRDDQKDARVNEIAINWNGALIYALAAFLND